MAVKKTGISRDLIIHPGETIADILEERGISQVELAALTGVSPAYVSNVIAGKKNISAKFAFALEYALDVPKSFWLNLQANYDAELLEFMEESTITEEELEAREALKDIVKFLRQIKKMLPREKKEDSILSLRKALKVSNLANLKDIVPAGAFRMASNTTVDPYVLGAWIRICQLTGEKTNISGVFDPKQIDSLITELKQIMNSRNVNLQVALRNTMEKYGIDFSIIKNFRGAPVHGYICQKPDESLQMVVTIRGAYADIFWFSLFHELGHIMNGDIGRTSKFLDDGSDEKKEIAADKFARDKLLDPTAYTAFISKNDFSIETICAFAKEQNVRPYIVIGRLQKEKYLDYSCYSDYKTRYKWES
ncbi:MAG: HigA family addiction module antitoxin [Lachnospiraceae bacterium]|nr:HigA family addiction module antitoxin [Lachnospiraceae bacterium]MDY4969440.1 HigA family addiction module antitoxin [Lachnospiraceae bacterium]